MKQLKQSSTFKIILLTSVVLISICLIWSTEAEPVQGQGRSGLVLAFYYAWYNPGSFGPGKTPFQPPEPYSSSDPSTIQRHVNQARSAGIDGFVQSWYGPNEPYTNGNFQALLDIASASGFKAAIDFEPATFMSSNDERASALKSLLETHANHPAYLRMDGKPVIFFWANWAYSVEDWAYIRSIADPNHNSIWIAEGGNTEYLSVFDGLHLYNIAWAANPAGIASTWAANTRAAAETYGGFKYWAATAMPGFDDRHLGRGDASVFRDRAGGAYYQNSFAAAAESNPDLLLITSFNEWAEGSNIEPSVEFGNQYLDLTAQLIAGYKSGAVAPPPPLPEATSAPSTDPDAEPASEQEGSAPSEARSQAPTPFASPTAQPDGRIVYEVQAGDTLSAIAFRFDVPLADLYSYNDLESDSVLNIGQPLVLAMTGEITSDSVPDSIPEGSEVGDEGVLTYEVQAEDTLIGIAVQFELSLEELLAMNDGIDEGNVLQIGQEIVVGQQRGPASVGGSTDFPEEAVTKTPVSTTETTTPTLKPSPEALATTVATSTTDATATSEPTMAATSTAIPSPTATAPRAEANATWLPVAGGLFTLVGLTGGLFLYLGRRRR